MSLVSLLKLVIYTILSYILLSIDVLYTLMGFELPKLCVIACYVTYICKITAESLVYLLATRFASELTTNVN